MNNLYEISTNIRELNDLAGRELTEEQQIQFEEIKQILLSKISKKADSIVHVINKNKNDINSIKEEIKRLKDLQNSLEKKNQSLNDFLVFGLENSGLNEIDLPTMKIKLGKLPDLLIIDDAESVKEEFMKQPQPQEPKPDKKALLDSYKSTGIVPAGCSIKTNRKKINVK